jgi:hypothetical protein
MDAYLTAVTCQLALGGASLFPLTICDNRTYRSVFNMNSKRFGNGCSRIVYTTSTFRVIVGRHFGLCYRTVPNFNSEACEALGKVLVWGQVLVVKLGAIIDRCSDCRECFSGI